MGLAAKALIRLLIQILTWILWEIYEDMVYEDYMFWDSHLMEMNHGQTVLREWYMQPELAMLLEGDWFFNWPPKNAEKYTEMAFLPHWAIERCLYLLVGQAQEQVSRYVSEAQMIKEEIQFLRAILPFA